MLFSLPPIILASSSQYRKKRLIEAGIKAKSIASSIDESPLQNESAHDLAMRLAQNKAEEVARNVSEGLVIGCDQTAEIQCKRKILGKPVTFEKALQQLTECSGQTVTFYSALHLIDASNGNAYKSNVMTSVEFATLTDEDIANYLNNDKPLDCAGSFKVEAAGIFLFEKITSEDPNALLGIPMIELRNGFKHLGYNLLSYLNR